MSVESVLSFDDTPPANRFDSPTDTRQGSNLSIGMYHPWAGTRHAGGIATYVQKVSKHLPRFSQSYLYTVEGAMTDDVRDSDITVIGIPGSDGIEPIERKFLGGLLPCGITERLPVFRNTLSTGTVRHINENLDVLVTHDYLDEIYLSNLVDVPVVRIHHGLQDVGIGAKLRERSTKACRTIANSTYTSDEIARYFGYEADDIVHPGVELDTFRPDRTPAFDSDHVAILYVGRFTERKGIYDLLDAFRHTVDRTSLYIVGRGDENSVNARARELGIENRVTILGEVPHCDLPAYYAACDVLCNPSHYESFGMVNLEAMASGKPLVTTETGGVQEYSTDGITGFHVPVGDSVALSDAIDALAGAPGRRKRMGTAAREAAMAYSWEESARKLHAICADVCEPRPEDDGTAVHSGTPIADPERAEPEKQLSRP